MLEDGAEPSPFDVAALQAWQEQLSSPNGMEIGAFLATYDELFAAPRSPADVQAYREGRKPWKKLADEVAPVAVFLQHAKIAGRIRFPLNDQPPDAWLLEDGSQAEVGIEVTRVLARSKHETAKSMQDQTMVPGFLGLPDNAPSEVYKQVKARGRITNSRAGIEKKIEASISERLAGKSDPKFQGQTLLLVTPLASLPDHDWGQLRQRRRHEAEQTAFQRIFLVDDPGSKPPVLLFDRAAQGAKPAPAEP